MTFACYSNSLRSSRTSLAWELYKLAQVLNSNLISEWLWKKLKWKKSHLEVPNEIYVTETLTIFCWNRNFLLSTTISIDLTAKFHSFYVKESELEILERSESEILEALESESDILPTTPQPCLSGCWRCNAIGRSQTALPLLHHKENAPSYDNSDKKCASLAAIARYITILYTIGYPQTYKAEYFFLKKHCRGLQQNHKLWLYFT